MPARDVAAATSPMDPEKARWSEIRRDELVENIKPADLQVVVLMPIADCTGSSANNRVVVRKWHCAGLMRLGTHPSMSATPLLLVPEDFATDSVSETARKLAEEGIPTTARYLLIVDWQIALRNAGGSYYNMALATESVLFDRRDQRWLWHAVHRHERYTGEGMKPDEVQRDLMLMLKGEVLPPLLRHTQIMAPSERYGMSWVASSQAMEAPAPDRTRVVLFNDYSKILRTYEAFPDDFVLLANGDEGDAASPTESPSAVKLRVGTRSYLAFDVQPGDYTLFGDLKVRVPLKLQPGQTTYLRFYRGWLNAHEVEPVSAQKAAELKAESVNAVLQDVYKPGYQRTQVRFVQE